MNYFKQRQLELNFKGSDYVKEIDYDRLETQYFKILRIMSDSKPRSLRQISDETGHPEASISAQLRFMRRNGHTVIKERKNEGSGTWIYTLQINKNNPL